MDDKIKAALQGIIGKQHAQQGPANAQQRHAAADAYIALWNSKQQQVVKPAFKEFRQHLATEYKIDSYVDDSVGIEVLTVISDPGIRFIFGERPMFGDVGDASFFELRCVSASQTLKASFEVHRGADVESGSVEGTVTLNDLTADWIHQQLTRVLAKSYGQEMPTEDTPAPEAAAQDAPPPEAATDATQPPDAAAQDTPSDTPSDTSPDTPSSEAAQPEAPPPESSDEQSPSPTPEAPESNSAAESTTVQAPDPNPQDNQVPDDAADAQNPAQDSKEPPP